MITRPSFQGFIAKPGAGGGPPPSLLAKAGSFAANTATGNQSITGVGFQPKVVIFFYNDLTADGNGADANFGMGVGISSTDRRVGFERSRDAQTTSAHGAANQPALCIFQRGWTSGPIGWADFVSQDADGFTINWIDEPGIGFVVNYLALGGTALTNFKTGAVPSSTSTGNVAVTGVGFQPDAVIFFIGRASTVTPLDSATSNGASCIGIFTSANQARMSWRSKNGANPQIARHMQSTGSVFGTISDAGEFAEASFVSMDADGFTLNWSIAPGTADLFYYLALKGPQFKVGSFNQATSTGNQATTGVGFQPKAAIFMSLNDVSANNDTNAAHARVSLGMGTAPTARGSIWYGDQNGVSPTIAQSNLDRTKIIKMMTEGTPTVNAAADLVSFDSDGHTLNWTTVDATARQVLGLWIG